MKQGKQQIGVLADPGTADRHQTWLYQRLSLLLWRYEHSLSLQVALKPL